MTKEESEGEFDGVYSVTFSGPAGSALGYYQVEGTRLSGGDIAGARATGTIMRNPDRSVTLDIEADLPPDAWMIRGTTPTFVWHKRHVRFTIPADAVDATFKGSPYFAPEEGVTVVIRQVPAEQFADMAGPGGLDIWIDLLTQVRDEWKKLDQA